MCQAKTILNIRIETLRRINGMRVSGRYYLHGPSVFHGVTTNNPWIEAIRRLVVPVVAVVEISRTCPWTNSSSHALTKRFKLPMIVPIWSRQQYHPQHQPLHSPRMMMKKMKKKTTMTILSIRLRDTIPASNVLLYFLFSIGCSNPTRRFNHSINVWMNGMGWAYPITFKLWINWM